MSILWHLKNKIKKIIIWFYVVNIRNIIIITFFLKTSELVAPSIEISNQILRELGKLDVLKIKFTIRLS